MNHEEQLKLIEDLDNRILRGSMQHQHFLSIYALRKENNFKMTKSVIVKSQVKELAKIESKQLSVAEEFYKELEEKVRKDIENACKRAKLNSRNTIMARDL